MIGLCNGCWSSGEIITLDIKGLPKCVKCHDKEMEQCRSG